jgi:hypothetical protein
VVSPEVKQGEAAKGGHVLGTSGLGGMRLLAHERSIGYEPVMLEGADSRQSFVVTVVVDQWHIRVLGRRADQEVHWRNPTMISRR